MLNGAQNDSATVALAIPSPRTPLSHIPGLPSTIDEGRFPPGTLIAARYRVSGMLGKGGMGEVYRASDLVLGQPVALKFLPESLSSNPSMVARFYAEVRIARQVSHPNVCRVYDIGEVDGLLYLSMEYVNGEDLGSLLRRIGRLPSDKAAEIARKLCAGVAAAHEKGILHRDLKPANIMLDGSGQIYIMDFGLAGVAAQLTAAAEIRNGTPAYMSPEQLAGREVTVRSDIYSLGLVLYEIYTGKRPFEASSLADLIKMQESATPVSISSGFSSAVRDLDPAVEKVIARCLSADPKDRPASALQIAAALPGGDPIAAALAAGETPTPQLIAASGGTEGLPFRVAVACLAFTFVALIAIGALGSAANSRVLAGLDYPPEVLRHKAAEVSRKLGYPKLPSVVSAFDLNNGYREYAKRNRIADPLNPRGPNQTLSFWVRESPSYIYTDSFEDVGLSYPAFDAPGMRRMVLDPEGDLLSFEAVPPMLAAPPTDKTPDWNPLFEAAGLDPSIFADAKPEIRPSVPVDKLSAWWACYSANGRKDILVEAGSWRGKPVWFKVTPNWDIPKPSAASKSATDYASDYGGSQAFQLIVFITLVGGAGLLAWHNGKQKRADKPGAAKLGQFGVVVALIGWATGAVHVLGTGEFMNFQGGLAIALLLGALLYTLYLGLEPFVRRLWPHAMISWTRVMTGHPRDPKVGSDLLIGTVWGVVWGLLYMAHNFFFARQGWVAPTRLMASSLLGGRHLVETLAGSLITSVQLSFTLFFAILLLRKLLRFEWLAAAVFALLFGVGGAVNSYYLAFDSVYYFLINAFFVIMLIRFGLLCTICGYFCFGIVAAFPVTLDLSAWYAASSVFPLFVVAAIAVFGFRTTLGRGLYGNFERRESRIS